MGNPHAPSAHWCMCTMGGVETAYSRLRRDRRRADRRRGEGHAACGTRRGAREGGRVRYAANAVSPVSAEATPGHKARRQSGSEPLDAAVTMAIDRN